ncbi:MAG TPA: SCP2 sterol-binding domain-containing protein, partial [Gammaproteobacteria bacterium]|nr:SCP2 sterol-binding domain-containing protein [Gammaproteobacteria bacterium]
MNTPQPVHIRALEGALNRYLNLDPDTPSRFAALTGKIIAVELEGLGRTIYFAPESDGVGILADYPGVPDATLRGTLWALLRMGSLQSDSRAAREALALGAVRIGGDVELGQRFKQILDAVEIDWEEHLAGLVGDLLAHKLGNAARAAQGWARQAAATLG